MRKRPYTKLVQEGAFVAEVDVNLIETIRFIFRNYTSVSEVSDFLPAGDSVALERVSRDNERVF